jgi:hypothetical protein
MEMLLRILEQSILLQRHRIQITFYTFLQSSLDIDLLHIDVKQSLII